MSEVAENGEEIQIATGSSSAVNGSEQSDGDGVQVRRGMGPWRGPLPEGDHLDPELLRDGDYRNVEDQFRYWKRSAIKEAISNRSLGYEVAIENLGHDFNIGSIVRTSNALGVSKVHIVGRRRWNRRGAMVTDRYLDVDHHFETSEFADEVRNRGLSIVGIDNLPGSTPLEDAELPRDVVLVFGEEGAGLSEEMLSHCDQVLHVTQYGSTRSMNVGHAAAIAMWAWVMQHRGR